MRVVSSREFRDHQKRYFDLASKERIIIKRKNDFLEIVPRGNSIPESVSPSNDPYFDNPKNLVALDKSIQEAEKNIASGEYITIDPNDPNKSIWEQMGFEKNENE